MTDTPEPPRPEPENPGPSRRGRPWARWLLVASLGLNLLIVGMAAGAFLLGPRHPPPPPGAAIWHYGKALPDPYRRALAQDLRASRGDWSSARDTLRGQREALAAALEIEPYDPAAVAAVLDREASLTVELATRGTGLLLAQISRMPPADRRAYAEALRRDRGPEGRDGKGPRHDGSEGARP